MNRKSLQRLGLVALLAAITAVIGPRTAFAHTGVGPAHDLLHGLAHPLTGLDHILAMFAVGLWAAGRGGRAIWLVPLTFIAVMTLAGALGMSGIFIPFVEPAIVLSIIILGFFVAAAVRLPLPVSVFIVALFALAHGYAHGAAIAASASGFSFSLGFAATTALLHAAGISAGLALQRLNSSQIARLAGAAIAVGGLYLGVQ
jgi:urease accessory protein